MAASIDEIWKDDLLGRSEDAKFLLNFLIRRIKERGDVGLPRSYVLNLNAAWGHGKSFFLTRLKQHLEAEGYLVASVNAWRDDHADDPLLAVMAAIDHVVLPHIQTRKTIRKSWEAVRKTGAAVAVAAVKGAALHWTRKALGDGVDAALEALGNEDQTAGNSISGHLEEQLSSVIDERAELLLASFKEGQRSIDSFREQLSKFIQVVPTKHLQTPMFVLVDELDRCRPSYAISLLERIKHLFNIDDVVFIVATDTDQLRHSVGAIYGLHFDGERYLSRFFDRTYVFEEPSLEQFTQLLISQYPLGNLSLPPGQKLETYISNAFSYFGFSLREAEQSFDILRSVTTVWALKTPIELAVLLPLVIGHQRNLRPSLDQGFIDRLTKLRDENHGRADAWNINFSSANRYEAEHRDLTLSGLNLFQRFISTASNELSKVMNDRGGDLAEQWIRHQLRNEFGVEHRNVSYFAGPMSVVRQYLPLIRSAGRLAPETAAR